jgi:hypothetical protein
MTTDIEDEIADLEAELLELEAAGDELRQRFHSATSAKVSHDLGDALAARKLVQNRIRALRKAAAAPAASSD